MDPHQLSLRGTASKAHSVWGAQDLGEALGNVALLVEWVSVYLGAPLLHPLSFCGSTSSLGRPRNFWDTEASPASASRALYPTLVSPSVPPDASPRGYFPTFLHTWSFFTSLGSDGMDVLVT